MTQRGYPTIASFCNDGQQNEQPGERWPGEHPALFLQPLNPVDKRHPNVNNRAS